MKRVCSVIAMCLLILQCTYAYAAAQSVSLQLPAGTRVIEEEAFYENALLESVELPEGIERIESKAFAQCLLRSVNLPQTLVFIADDAFEGSDELVAAVSWGSYAYRWCLDNDVDVSVVDLPDSDGQSISILSMTLHTSGDEVEVGAQLQWDALISGGAGDIQYLFTLYCDGLPVHADDDPPVWTDGYLKGASYFYTPLEAGVYCVHLKATDSNGETAEMTSENVTVAAWSGEETPISQFTWRALNDQEAAITGYTGEDAVVCVPAQAAGRTVTAIDSGAFRENHMLAAVVLPDSVKEIGSEAFYSCSSLMSVDMGSGVTAVGKRAFEYCSALNNLQVSAALKTIGEDAFRECDCLTQITLPDSVETIDLGAFNGCDNLEKINIPLSWKNVYGNGFDSNACAIFGNCPKLTSIAVPEGMTALPSRAFFYCDNLFEVKLPESLTSIGSNAFEGCKGLRSIDLPEGIRTIETSVFENCTGLQNVALPEGTVSIGQFAFRECDSFTQITLPDSVETIDLGAFNGCDNLEKINIPLSWKNVYGNGAAGIFGNCPKLTTIIVPEGMTELPSRAFSFCETLTQVQLPESLTSIGSHAFEGCKSLRSIDLPAGIRVFEISVFDGCTSLGNVMLPEGTVSIGQYAFRNCDSFTQITLPDSVETMNMGAFNGCDNLEKINIPLGWKNVYGNGWDHVDNGVFGNCPKLTSIIVPEGMTALPACAFYYCANLKNVTLPDSLTSIGSRAFMGCKGIEKLYLSSSITSIGSDCFTYCTNLKIYCEYGSCALQHAMSNGIAYCYLSLVNAWIPSGTIYQGDANHLSGMIRSSDPIVSAQVKLVDAAGNVLRSGSVSNGGQVISLGAYLDGCISLSTLPLGTYSIVISAATEEEEETFIRSSFTVAPQPLRLKLIGVSVPSGLYEIGASFVLKGTIQSNYAITSITAGVYNHDGSPTELVATVSPNTTSYDLSNLFSTAWLDQLSDGKYSYQIRAVSNGETKLLKKSSFGMGTAGGEGIKDDELRQMLVFGAKAENKLVFAPLTYHQTYLNSLSYWEILQVLLSSGESIASQWLGDMMQGNEYNSYAVNLYKSHLASAIEKQSDSDYVGTGDLELYKLIGKWMKAGMDVQKLGLKAYLYSVEKEYEQISSAIVYAGVLQFGEIIDGMGIVNAGLSNTTELCEVLELYLRDYEKGSKVIDAVASAMGATGNVNFDEAVRQVHQEYSKHWMAQTRNALNDVWKWLGKESIDFIKDQVSKSMFGTIDLARTILFELSGFSEHANNIMAFVTGSEAFHHAERAYMNAFDAVYGGDESEEALRRLLICFKFTYDCAEELYYTIYDLSPISKKQEVLDHINYDLRPISIWH